MARSVIYEPKGKAGEYAPLALNLYDGCVHGCVYCYAPTVTHTNRNVFHQPGWVAPRAGVLKDLAIQAPSLAGDPRPILLSFTSDPYQPAEKRAEITRGALKILVDNKLKVTILTKSGLWGLVRDRDIFTMRHDSSHCSDSLARQGYPQAHTWAATLTLDDPDESLKWEPGAALPRERIMGLAQAKAWGFDTWVSFEPVIDPEAVYRLLDATHEFVDFYKVGKLNYHPHAQTIDWRRFKMEMEERLTRLGKPHYFKKDLLEAAK